MVDENIQKAVEEAGEIDMDDDGKVVPEESTETPVDTENTQDDNTESQSSETESQDDTSSEDAKTPSETKDVPFHEHPRFQELTKQNREYKEQIGKLHDAQQQLLGRLEQMGQKPTDSQQQQLTPEQEQAKEQLIDLMGMRGVAEQVAQLKAQNEQLSKAQIDKEFDAEEKEVLSNIKKFGLAKTPEECDAVLDNLQKHIDSNPSLSKIKASPGVWKLAFNDYYINHASELGERTAAKKEIQRQQELKKQKLESGTPPAKGGEMKLTGNVVNDTVALLNKAGGVDAVDMDS